MRVSRIALFAVSLVLLAGPARGQNALDNPNFQTSVADWSSPQTFETVVWKDIDADGSPSTGAADLTNRFAQVGTQGGGSIGQCAPVTGGASYNFGAKAHIPAAQSNTGYAQVQIAFYSGPVCSGGFLSLSATQRFEQVDSWQPLAFTATAPANAVSASFNLAHFKNEAGGEFVTHFDDAYLSPAGAAAVGLLTLPAVASVHGANGTFFHSDVWILNRSFAKSQSLTFHYRCFNGLSCPSAPMSIVLAPRESRLFTDIVAATLAAPETGGALEIGYDASRGELTASSRLYTPSLPSPTSGFSLPALQSSGARTRSVFVGLAGSGGDLSQGFRSNAGAYNPNDAAVNVTFTVYSSAGAVLGTPVVRAFSAHQSLQINDIFSVAGASATATNNAYLVVTTDGLPVFPYAAVIDNKSGDSVWVIPSEDEDS